MSDTLNKLYKTIESRKSADSNSSYVAKLFEDGIPKIGRKVCEEATETLIAAMEEGNDRVTSESADLLFHLIVLLSARNVEIDEVLQELEKRMGISGLDEKALRTSKEKGK